MKSPFNIYLLLLACCFTACKEFFNHPIDFKGNVQDPKMVVSTELQAGAHPEVFVNTAFFANDPNRIDTVEVQGNNVVTALKKGYLHDAIVEMRINGGEWILLHETHEERIVLRAQYYADYAIPTEQWFYTCDHILQPNDSVEIHVRHQGLNGDAYVSQRVPPHINAYVTDLDTLTYRDRDGIEFFLRLFSLHLEECPESDYLLRITAKSYTYQTKYISYDNSVRDKRIVYPDVYAQDVRFGTYLNLCKQMSQGWFGSLNIGLFANTPFKQSVIPIAVRYEAPYSENYKDGSPRERYGTDSIVIDVQLVNKDTYLYVTSLVENNLVVCKPSLDYWANQSYNDAQSIIKGTEDLIGKLGTLETYPTYSNIQGAIGHASSAAGTRIIIKRE